jgi:hypothetical protein
MAEAKTKKTTASVTAFIAAIEDADRRRDCQAIAKLMKKVTGDKAAMWGTGIVGFGTAPIAYADGREEDWPLIAFAPRAQNLVLYGTAHKHQAPMLKKLGKHKVGGGCLYVNRVDDIDLDVLEAMLRVALARKAKAAKKA